jgi:hypothetical protein
MITTNLLFACLGVACIALGLIGMKDGFIGATLFPGNIFKRMFLKEKKKKKKKKMLVVCYSLFFFFF